MELSIRSVFENGIVAYNLARSAGYGIQNNVLARLSAGPFEFPVPPTMTGAIEREGLKLYKADARNIREGIYPASVLWPESPLRHWTRFPRLMVDGLKLSLRKRSGRTTVFDPKIQKETLKDLPRYYRRNFHFQTNGYLSTGSAELWDHQVELLFKGTGDAMRRLIIPQLREHLRSQGKPLDGRGATFLELGISAGRSTRFVRLAFPKAKIVAVDLSDAYLRVAREKLADLDRIDFVQADGADLPFKDGKFDAAYSVFLFHELPLAARRDVLNESVRVLKTGGFLGLVDSLQLGDSPEFDPLLKEFPVRFHEPFYRNYVGNPMEGEMEAAGLREVRSGTGFLSKWCASVK